MVKSTYVKKVNKEDFVVELYCWQVKIHFHAKTLLENVVKNWSNIVVLFIEHFNLTPLC